MTSMVRPMEATDQSGSSPIMEGSSVPSLRPVGRSPGGAPAYTHDFLVLVFFERGGGGARLGRREVPIEHGDVLVVAPGAVIGRATEPLGAGAVGWAVWFPADVLDAPGAALAWRSHPLLSAFAGGARRLRVPEADRAAWSARCTALVDELEGRREGHHEAVLAHLTLLLVALSRLASAAPGGMRLRDEPLLGAVFAEIQARLARPL